MATAMRCAPGILCGWNPRSRTFCATASTSSSLATECITINMALKLAQLSGRDGEAGSDVTDVAGGDKRRARRRPEIRVQRAVGLDGVDADVDAGDAPLAAHAGDGDAAAPG